MSQETQMEAFKSGYTMALEHVEAILQKHLGPINPAFVKVRALREAPYNGDLETTLRNKKHEG